jgi:DNA-binding MarR family transcriptional regulator
MPKPSLSDADYERLYDFRSRVLKFLRWSEDQIKATGLTPSQYLLLLGIRGAQTPPGPTIGAMAEFLMLRHHSAVELADRAESAGLIRRNRDPEDGRVVRLSLTAAGKRQLERLATMHLHELSRLELVADALETPG